MDILKALTALPPKKTAPPPCLVGKHSDSGGIQSFERGWYLPSNFDGSRLNIKMLEACVRLRWENQLLKYDAIDLRPAWEVSKTWDVHSTAPARRSSTEDSEQHDAAAAAARSMYFIAATIRVSFFDARCWTNSLTTSLQGRLCLTLSTAKTTTPSLLPLQQVFLIDSSPHSGLSFQGAVLEQLTRWTTMGKSSTEAFLFPTS